MSDPSSDERWIDLDVAGEGRDAEVVALTKWMIDKLVAKKYGRESCSLFVNESIGGCERHIVGIFSMSGDGLPSIDVVGEAVEAAFHKVGVKTGRMH